MTGRLRMHVERTDDSEALDWVVRDDRVQGTGRASDRHASWLPAELAELFDSGLVRTVVVQDGRIRVSRSGEESWDRVAPIAQAAIQASLADGRRIVAGPVPLPLAAPNAACATGSCGFRGRPSRGLACGGC